MAENFNDYGDYSNELEYQSRSKVKKVFSFRTIKKIFKILLISLIVFIYGFLTYRIIESKIVYSKDTLIWTDEMFNSYTSDSDKFVIYSYVAGSEFAYNSQGSNSSSDGKFSVYDTIYIPSTKELQFTIRYNNSTVDTLNNDYSLSIDPKEKMPFKFILKSTLDEVYEECEYTFEHEGRYNYLRIVFKNVDINLPKKVSPSTTLPNKEINEPGYIYKGINKFQYEKNETNSLLLNMYYEEDYNAENKSYGMPIYVYDSSCVLDYFDFSKELPNGPTTGLIKVK